MDSHAEESVPRYRQVAEQIRRDVAGGRYTPGERLPSEGALARAFGISRGTLRQALGALGREGLVQTVPGYGSIVSAQSDTTPTTGEDRGHVVGVVIPSVARTRIPDLIAGAEAELRAAGYTLLLVSSGDDCDEEARQIRRLVETGVDGLLVYPVDGASNLAFLRGLLEAGPPLVLIDRYLVGLSADAVVADNMGGAYSAVRWLIEAGRERIGLASTRNLGTSSIAERQAGYWWALRQHGRLIEPRLSCTDLERLFNWPVPQTEAADLNRRLLRTYLTGDGLTGGDRPDAVFAVNDTVAFQVLEMADELGLRVPDDLAVVGFDNLASPDYAGVPLTTVDQPRAEIGAAAARIVLQRIAGRPARGERVVLSTRLIVRGSCGGESRRLAATRSPRSTEVAGGVGAVRER